MQDIYGAIIGEPPSEEEKLAMLAQKLRGRNQLGALIQLSGDKVAAPIGKGIIDQTEEQASQISRLQARKRELAAQKEMALTEDQAALGRLDKQHQGQMALEKARQAFEREQNALDRQNDLDEAGIRKGRGGKVLGFKDIEKLSTVVEENGALAGVIEGFQDAYGGSGVPGGRALANTIVSFGYGDKGMEDAQKWWSDWKRLYELPTRNKLFGSALTATEQAAWKAANITQDMKPEQIRRNLQTLHTLRAKAMTNLQRRLKVSYDPDDVDAIFEGGVENLAGGDVESAVGGQDPSAPLDPTQFDSYEDYLKATGGK